MASKQEKSLDLMGKFQKKSFFETMQIKHRELAKRQREYKEILGKRHKTRGDTIIEKSLFKAIDALQQERNDLRAQIWVANGAPHMHENEMYLKEIKCHVDCQENLAKDISDLKVAVANMEREVSRVDREIYELNRQIVPETQHQEHVARMRKKVGILENQLEVGVRRECIFSAENARLREDLKNILYERKQFNDIYTKLVQYLNSDKKYMSDLVEYAVNMFENCINVSERTDLRLKNIEKEREVRKTEVQALMRTAAATQVMDEFVGTKSKTRRIAPHQPKELRRRADYKRFHERRIKLFNQEIDKLLKFTNSHTVYDVIERYQQHESLYYSYFTLDNERGFHITLLNNYVNRLFNQVQMLKAGNAQRLSEQSDAISELEKKLEQRQIRSREIQILEQNENKRLDNYLAEIQTIMTICKLSNAPLLELLGDHTRVTLENMRRFTKILEGRILMVLRNVYLAERADPKVSADRYVVREIDKTIDFITRLEDIVLTQQCAECAEGEAFTADEIADGWIPPLTTDEAKQSLFEKVTQPEMQYRLHSISQCRLPRSRLLAAKRNI